MKCSECVELDQRSTIQIGSTRVTLLGWAADYDEDGVYHSHDPNAQRTEYGCSYGHLWVVSKIPKCPAGDYPR